MIWIVWIVIALTSTVGAARCHGEASTATSLPSITNSATGKQGVLATVNVAATSGGLRVLQEGGNAVDAAISAALTLGVVDGFNSGIGGGCFILLHTHAGELIAIDGREMAPAAATRDMFLRNGVAVPELSQTGPLAVGVPGALAAYELALRRYGTKQLAELLLPAAAVAEQGFELSESYARSLRSTAAELQQFPGSREVFLQPNGVPHTAGSIMTQPDLADTYRAVAEHGVDWFYQGPFAERVGAWMEQNGGLIRTEDFANYRAVVRPPVVSQYRGYTIVGFPPPSSGGVHVAQILNMLEPFPVADIYRRSPSAGTHLVTEAMKRAFADRAYWLGDADFAPVPRGLLDKDYARHWMRDFDPHHATLVASHGTPPRATEDQFGDRKHTTHIAAADQAGNWVAITATVNTTFGSKVIVPGTGVVLNNEMDDFSSQPGIPNAFGLVGAEHNAIAPGKRPLSSMSPTLVLEKGKPIMTLGAAGGPKIITQVVSTLVRYLDLHQPLDTAVATSRFHHQWSPDTLYLESDYPTDEREQLRQLGHSIELLSSIARLQAIVRMADGQTLQGVADPRVESSAQGW